MDRSVDIRVELQLVKKLHRLSKTSWSPTLRAHAQALELRERELQAAAGEKVKAKNKS